MEYFNEVKFLSLLTPVSCPVVDGFKHAFPGRLLHYAGGEEKTEDA